MPELVKTADRADELPDDAAFTVDVSSVTPGGVVDPAAGTIIWKAASLAPGQSVTYRSGTVDPMTAATDVVNVPSSPSCVARCTWPPGGLSVSKAVAFSDAVVNTGDTLTYR